MHLHGSGIHALVDTIFGSMTLVLKRHTTFVEDGFMAKKEMNIEFKVLKRKTVGDDNGFRGKKEMTNLVTLVAIGVQGERCKKVANCKQCKRW
jgi:hypothetical protein